MTSKVADNRYKKQLIIVVSCVIFAVLMVIALVVGLVNLATATGRKKELEAKLAAIEQQIAQNENNIAYYSSDEYIERIAREYLNLQGKDEITFVGK